MQGPLKYETSVKKNIGKLPPECYDTIDGIEALFVSLHFFRLHDIKKNYI